jgi:hypothetical protein
LGNKNGRFIQKPPSKEAFETLDSSHEGLGLPKEFTLKGTNNEYCYARNGT